MIFNKKYAACFVFLASVCFSAYTAGKIDIETVVRTKSVNDIKKILFNHQDLIDHTSAGTRNTLVMTALESGREKDVIDLLLKSGIDPALKNREGQTALMFACQYSSDPDIVQNITESGTVFQFQRRKRVLERDKNGKTAFDYAAGKSALLAVLSRYAENPVRTADKAEQTNTGGQIPQNTSPQAVSSDQAAKTETQGKPELSVVPVPALPPPLPAIDKPVDQNQPVYLFDFLDYGNTEDEQMTSPDDTVQADAVRNDTVDQNGLTPLMKAAGKADLQEMSRLISGGADVNAKDSDGWNALMYATRFSGSAEAVKLLVSAGTDMTVANRYGISPLLLAAGFSENPEIIRILLSKRNPVENEVRNAFILAITTSRPIDMIQVFIKMGIPLNQMYKGKTPLMYAAENGTETRIISFLLGKGALTDIHTTDNKTAFDFAAANMRMPHDTVYWSLNSGRTDQSKHTD